VVPQIDTALEMLTDSAESLSIGIEIEIEIEIT